MSADGSDKVFAGSVPELYETYMVPLIFAFYAADIARRLAARQTGRLLEIAAGTGVVTRALATASASRRRHRRHRSQPADARPRGRDRNEPRRRVAAGVDAMLALPFDDATFDVVVCQFGAMFFPDRAKAFAQARRVLVPGGLLLFNVWDRIAENEFADTVTAVLADMFPADPPLFLARTPHGYFDRELIARDLAEGGFKSAASIQLRRSRACSRALSARIPAFAYGFRAPRCATRSRSATPRGSPPRQTGAQKR